MRTLSTLLAIQTSTVANVFIYYLRKLPLLGRILPSDVYTHREWKRLTAILVRILITLWGFVSRFAYVGLVLYWPVMLRSEALSKAEQLQQFAHLFFMISFIAAGVSYAVILEPKRSKYIAIKLMRMSPVRYMLATLTFKYVTFFIYLLPAMLLFAMLLGASVLQAILLAASLTAWRVWCEYLHLKLFEAKGIVLIRQTGWIWIVILLSYAGAYAPLFAEWVPPVGTLMLLWPVHVISIGLGAYAAYRLKHYPDYRTVTDAATKRDDPMLDMARMMKEANMKSVQSKSSDYTIAEAHQNQFATLKGYRYLNAIFFARHRSLVRRPLQTRLMSVVALGVVGIFLASSVSQIADGLLTHLARFIPILFIAMSMLTIGENLCKAIFYNCDLSLLRYSFYRQASFQHFRIRLLRITGLNLLIAIALCAALTAVYAAAGGNPLHSHMVMLWISVLGLACFFSVHHLFVYYILQPYTTELNVRSPLYYVATYAISIIGGLCIVIPIPAHIFTAAVLTVTSLYVTVALALVRRYGSRTFYVK